MAHAYQGSRLEGICKRESFSYAARISEKASLPAKVILAMQSISSISFSAADLSSFSINPNYPKEGFNPVKD